MAHLGNTALLASLYCSVHYLLEFRYASAADYTTEYGPDYGKEWLLFVDDNGTTHTMNFSSIPSDLRGMVFGDAYFYLYTRRNDEAEMLILNSSTINSKYFNSSNDAKVVTHGWLSSQSTEWLQRMKSSHLKKSDYNVILVDWSELAGNPIYPWPAFATRYVGRRIAELLSAIQKTYQVGGDRVHLIGHSLGAHVMGYAGMFSQDRDNRIKRITGLDPARPLFELPPMRSDYRLEKSDATFVDIIHTCGGIYGYDRSNGHADFYPNSGRPRQPGCDGARMMIDACSHGRSPEFFDESILSETPFVAYPCESWQKFRNGECTDNPSVMGYPAPDSSLGDYYLYTNAEPPYAIECRCVSAADYIKEYGPDYGTEWLQFLDDNGTTHTMNFSSIPSDQRGMAFGDAYFYLYTRRNDEAEILVLNRSTINSKYFNPSNDAKIVTHGWLGSQSMEWLQKMKTSFLKKNDYNVILVDWSELADNPFYPWSAFATRYVGRRTAELLSAIQKTYQVGGDRVHLIGHSLGAQVMGYAGMFSQERDNRIKRITGLDPARPLFELPPMRSDYRLEKSDAAFVDIIHTCGGIYGYDRSNGHADFYPNSGRPPQPGCAGVQEMINACSHERSNELFVESILSETPFVAYPCESWQKFRNGECTDNPSVMGYPAPDRSLGDYYLYTNAEPPYAIGNQSNT